MHTLNAIDEYLKMNYTSHLNYYSVKFLSTNLKDFEQILSHDGEHLDKNE